MIGFNGLILSQGNNSFLVPVSMEHDYLSLLVFKPLNSFVYSSGEISPLLAALSTQACKVLVVLEVNRLALSVISCPDNAVRVSEPSASD